MNAKRILAILGVVLLLSLLGCSSEQGAPSTVEQEQIQNAVRQYYLQNPNVPAPQITIDKMDQGWARVSVRTTGPTSQATYFFVQRRENSAPAGAPSLGPQAFSTLPNPPPVSILQTPMAGNSSSGQPQAGTNSGWVIVLGPKSQFTAAEMDAVGVPPDIRP